MSPDDLAVVHRSWSELCRQRTALVDRLITTFEEVGPSDQAEWRARWLVDSTNELVDLLATPSVLAVFARTLAADWPHDAPAPCFAVDGHAWLLAARDISSTWSSSDEQAWRRAWMLLADVLAEDSLSPF